MDPSFRIGRWLVAACLATSLLVLGTSIAAPARAGVAKGVCSLQLDSETATSPARASMVREVSHGLGARWVRINLNWAALEPTRGEYSPAELARIDALVGELHTAGTRIILTTYYLPNWATDSYWWTHPPAGFADGPQAFYPIRDDALRDYGDLGEFLARRYTGQVQALECWNEPNLWPYLYPQRTEKDPFFAARVYLGMLKAFHAGVARAHTGVRIIAGATAPVGLNDIYRTSPQRFARFLQRSGAGRYFDVYSHHPYTPGGSIYTAPNQPPNDSSHTVTLYNLRTLLRLFPKKPFYLTEYGYSTQPSLMFGLVVTESVQARYLTTAYRYAARYPQVKLLVWFLVRDVKPDSGAANMGAYCGLRRPDGTRKPAWYAFRRL
jgi:polysaccharide biosynthesis protein PslG